MDDWGWFYVGVLGDWGVCMLMFDCLVWEGVFFDYVFVLLLFCMLSCGVFFMG